MDNQKLDRIMGGIIALLGLLTMYLSWIMPRFENLNASPWEFVGLTPIVIGCALFICGVLLAIRTGHESEDEGGYLDDILTCPIHLKRFLSALCITLFYGGVLFGNVPFIPATLFFIFAFFMIFTWFLPPETIQKPTLTVALTQSVVTSVIATLTIYLLFEQVFLVQLP